MKLRHVARIALAVVAVGSGACSGALKEPDAGGQGQLGGFGAGGGTGGAGGLDAGPTQIVDVRPPDEPCSLESPAGIPVAGETCRFQIPAPPCPYADRSHIGVKVGGVEIPYDPSGQDGWEFDDPSQTMIRINGTSCDAVTGGAGVTIIYKIILP